MERVLPFPRNDFFCQGAVTPSATIGNELEGKVVKVRDDAAPGNEKLLRIVRNASGSDITTVAGTLVTFKTTSESDFGCQASGYLSSSGGVCKPLDDKYGSKTWQNLDLAYVVEKGRCTVVKTSGDGGIAAGALVYGDSDGKANGSVSSGFAFGRCVVAASDTDTTVEVEVDEGLK